MFIDYLLVIVLAIRTNRPILNCFPISLDDSQITTKAAAGIIGYQV